MKVVALMKEANWPEDRVFLVEMTAGEIACMTGRKFDASKIKIGMEAEPTKILRHTEHILSNKHTTVNAAKNLRAMAELLESIEPIVNSAVQLPEDETAENEK